MDIILINSSIRLGTKLGNACQEKRYTGVIKIVNTSEVMGLKGIANIQCPRLFC